MVGQKRQTEEPEAGNSIRQHKKAKAVSSIVDDFAENILSEGITGKYRESYEASKPYKHAVISTLINDELLRGVRAEVSEKISFTEKETDIYKLHQSGDLANLDGLDDDTLKELPNLLQLRNALYSPEFRAFLQKVTSCGPLSGTKRDMAINIYPPGCHLLCHDDVIGSRRVSYILYLTDPGQPWKAEWGGALRLYPVTKYKSKEGTNVTVCKPDPVLSIPPAWNQLSFFAVQPGQSYHDVEEVFHSDLEGGDTERNRLAISGWFHIPQEGEAGYGKKDEDEEAFQSSLAQLKGDDDENDRPQPAPQAFPKADIESLTDDQLSEEDINSLLPFIAPQWFTPDAVASLRENFEEDCAIRFEDFLSIKFASKVRQYIVDGSIPEMSHSIAEVEKGGLWKVACPPHKHRYCYMPGKSLEGFSDVVESPLRELVTKVLPSNAFRKWLRLVTGYVVSSHDIKARRFRHGYDYELAMPMPAEVERARLEITLGLTPSGNFEVPQMEDDDEEEEAEATPPVQDEVEIPLKKANGKNGSRKAHSSNGDPGEFEDEEKDDDEDDDEGDGVVTVDNGGYEAYIQDESVPDIDELEDESEEDGDAATPSQATASLKQKSEKNDPAVYQTADSDEDDGVLFSMGAGFNRMSIVLRDQGILRFVKYVSRAAGADRWDISGEFDIDWELSESTRAGDMLDDSDQEVPQLVEDVD